MTLKQWLTRSVTLATLTALGACGGSGGSAPEPVVDPLPTSSNSDSSKAVEGSGAITRFGDGLSSITVGDVTYSTSAASLNVIVDDQPSTLSGLKVGNVVRIKASSDDDDSTPSASEIEQINDIEGPITPGSIDLAAGTFEVLGQTIRVVATTLFDDDINPESLEGLMDNDPVEVSVLLDGNGAYVASRIERDDDAGDFELTGIVSLLDAANFTFAIGPLSVSYASATLDDFDGAELANGDLVEIEGNDVDANGVLIAINVELISDDFDGDEGDFAQIEGFISAFTSPTDFEVDGYAVTTTDDTEYDDGSADDLAIGVRVEIEGELNEDGVLVADEVDFEDVEDMAEIELYAPVEAIDAENSTVTLLGLVILVEPSTSLEDDSDADMEDFALSDLAVGDWIEVTVYDSESGLEAVALERDDADDDDNEVHVEGPVSDIMEPAFSVIGVPVATTPDTDFESDADADISSADFFNTVDDGDLICVEGVWDGVTLTATEVEFED